MAIDAATREKVRAMNGGRCIYGNGNLDHYGFEIDHSNPSSRGGTDSLRNLRPTCPKHNREKGDSTATEFRARMERNPSLRRCGK